MSDKEKNDDLENNDYDEETEREREENSGTIAKSTIRRAKENDGGE
jgi:hypothetical protein